MDRLASIFIEAAHQASILPFASEATLGAMRSFGDTELALPMIVAIIGGLIGQMFNYVLGTLMMRLPSSPANQPLFATLKKHFNNYGFLSLVMCFLPLGSFLVFIAGSFKTPWFKVVPVVLAGLAFHYYRMAFG